MQQLPGFGSVAWALLCAVLCFVSYSTLKWSVEEFTTTEGNLVTEYVVSSGLVEYRREATTTNLDTGEVQYEHTLYTLECLQLTSRQCDLLRSSQDAGAVAVASKYIYVHIYLYSLKMTLAYTPICVCTPHDLPYVCSFMPI